MDKRDSLTTNRRFESRTGCLLKMGMRYMKEIGKYQILDLVVKHNHQLHLPETTTHMLAYQRKLSEVQAHEIDLAADAGIKQMALFELIYLRINRMRNIAYGEAGGLLQHFQQKCIENPSFYHAVQLDVDEQITNIFWADARMIMAYEYFGNMMKNGSNMMKNGSTLISSTCVLYFSFLRF